MTDNPTPETWAKLLGDLVPDEATRALRERRREIYAETVATVRAGVYEVDGRERSVGPEGEVQRMWAGTRFYERTDELVVPAERRGLHDTRVVVACADALDAALLIARPGREPAVLNMANRRHPGGGVLNGAGAQEENLFRRSTLFHSLYKFSDIGSQYDVPPDDEGRSYPIGRESGGIYSPHVRVFRGGERPGYPFLAESFPISVVTVPAINRPDTVMLDGERRLSDEMAAATQSKIRAILRIAAAHEHTELVLSAFGCGAFRNPPRHVARLFRETLAEDEFAGTFRLVAFAIINDHDALRPGSSEGNYAPFERELGVSR